VLIGIILLPGGLLISQEFTQSNLPIIVIETNGQTIPDEPKINVDMGIIYNGPGQINYVTDPFNEYDGIVGIEKRGSTSQWFFPKKQYAFETRDAQYNNLNVSILGLPEENDWILHAPYSDKSLMRNVLTYKWAREMGHYSSRTVYCELLLNGDYRGVYVLMEKIKRDDNRVDIAEMDEDDIIGDSLTGGYIIKIDKNEGAGNDGWYSQFAPYPGAWQDIYYQYHYPKPADIQEEQKQYIQQFVYDFESVMDSEDYNDPQIGYPSIIDINSFTDFVLVNEMTKNVDGYRLSTFLYKDRDSKNPKFKAGPVWDFNIALGNVDYYDGFDPEGWMINGNYAVNDDFVIPFWWIKLMDDPAFYQNMVLRWNVHRSHVLQNDSIFNFINHAVEWLEEPQQRNFERWPVLGEYIWPNYFIGDTYEEEVAYLTEWIEERITWMDEELRLQPIINEINYHSASSFDPGDWLEIFNPGGETVNLANWKLKSGNTTYYTFPAGAYLLSGSYIVVCSDVVQFNLLFPEVDNYVGNLQLPLDDQSGTIELYNSSDYCVDMLTYSNILPWPTGAGGTGNTIELIHYLTDNSKGVSWQISEQVYGSPGEPNSVALVPDLYINEFMADNDSIIQDEFGDYNDWIEIYNASASSVNIGGKYLTDDLSVPQKFQVPNIDPEATTIQPGGFLLLWADNEPEQGVLHLGFRLSQENEQVGLFMADGFSQVDTVSFGQQYVDVSFGRLTDGGDEWVYFESATPGESNEAIVNQDDYKGPEIEIYPNPVSGSLKFRMQSPCYGNLNIVVYNLFGELILVKNVNANSGRLEVGSLAPGIYTCIFHYDQNRIAQRFIKL